MAKARFIISLILTGAVATGAFARNPNVLDLKTSITDESIVYPESFETDSRKMLEGWFLKNYTSANMRKDTKNPTVSDAVIRDRLKKLPTVIEMPFNQIVRSYIDRYMERSREQVSALLGLSLYYMPIFEQALEERGLPQELKYLPVIESGLDPNAVSRHGAAGLWQFMLATGRGMGLEVNSLVDQRRDPYLSSAAAADYLSRLYETYNDWSLVIAAYNCGPGAVNKAIRRAGGDPKKHDFWSIYQYLSPETRGYYPMFIAANYVMTYYPEHNIEPVLPTRPLVTDTVGVSDHVHFNQISTILDIPVDELRVLNPQFRADQIPGSGEKVYMLVLPSQQVQAYIMSEDAIMAYDKEKYDRREAVEPGDYPTAENVVEDIEESVVVANHPADIEEEPAPAVKRSEEPAPKAEAAAPAHGKGGSKVIVHKVKKGETLAAIAGKYGVEPASIRKANNLRRNAVRPGMQLKVTVSADTQAEEPAKASAPTKSTPAKADKKQTAKAETSGKQGTTTEKPSAKSPKSSKKKKEKKQNAKPADIDHQIKSGESLSTIAKKYGVSVDAIKKANNISGDNIRAGKSLKIPTKASTGKKKKSKKKRR